jgi:hypothetical protein
MRESVVKLIRRFARTASTALARQAAEQEMCTAWQDAPSHRFKGQLRQFMERRIARHEAD